MIQEAMEWIESLVRKSSSPVKIDETPIEMAYLAGRDVVRIKKLCQPIRHRLDTLSAFIAMVKAYDGIHSIWVSGERVQAFWGAESEHRATLPLLPSAQMKAIVNIVNGRFATPPKELLKLLRTTFNKSSEHNAKLIAALRTIKIDSLKKTESVTGKAADSLGVHVSRTAIGIPDDGLPNLYLDFQPFSPMPIDAGCCARFDCDIDLETGAVVLTLIGSIEDVIAPVIKKIVDELSDLDPDVFEGSFSDK